MRKILLFIILHLTVLAGAQETRVKTDNSSGKTGAAVLLECGRQRSKPAPVIYIVDGVSYTANEFPEIYPEDIENIQVLKGETAAKLHGSAIDGVICITTKRKPGQIVVRDREDRKPLASASLVFNECYQEVNLVADEEGRVDTKGITPGRMPVEVSCVGYKKKTVLLDITKNSFHDIELERDYDTLQQVVVVGYHAIRCGRTIRGCGGVTIIDTIVSTVASTVLPAKPIQDYLQLYPNPSRSNTSIHLSLPSERGSRLQAELLNTSGQLIKTAVLPSGKAANARFDLPHLSSGIYYVRVTDVDLGKRYVGRVVVE